MTTEPHNVLAVAAATRRIGHAFFIEGVPYHWRVSAMAATSPQQAYCYVREYIEYYGPVCVVTERLAQKSRKGAVSRALINAVCQAARDAGIGLLLTDRIQRHANKYIEAEHLADRFPELMPYVPKRRRLWQSEPRRTILFEAVALGLLVVDAPVEES